MLTFDDILREAVPVAAVRPIVENEPGIAFRALYDGWVELGGYQRGKPRRSVRLIKIWLGKEYEVRSIETKLAGKTPMQRGDVANLLLLFLSRWRYEDSQQDDRPFEHGDLDRLIEQLTEEVYIPNANGRRRGLLLPRRGGSTNSDVDIDLPPTTPNRQTSGPTSSATLDDTFRSGDKIAELYFDTDALITVSRQRTFIGTDPGVTMVGFHALMDRLRAIDEEQGDRFRTLIWIVDAGRRQGDQRSQGALHNLDFLATQFRSLLLTDHSLRKKRAEWFLSRAAVLVGTLRFAEIDACYRKFDLKPAEPKATDRDWITGDRMFFEGLPDAWLEHIARYDPNAIRQRTVTVHRNLTADKTAGSGGADWEDLEFLFHMPLVGPDGKLAARCVDLPRPGVRWCDGIRTAHEVALLRLGLQAKPTLPYSPEEGLALLRDHRFAVLKAREFCSLSNNLSFESFE